MPISSLKSRGQKAAENHIAAVRDAGGPFVTAADQTRMPMLFSDPQLPGNPIIYANKSFLSLTGFERSEVLGQSYHFLMGPATDPDAQAQIEDTLSAGSFESHPEVRYYRKDGSSFWAIVFIGPVLDAAGKVTQHFVSFLDVTVQRQEERRLHLILNELNHRTQNTLATVQAIALQTLHGVADQEAVDAFEERILALSAAHRLLGATNWEGAGLRAVFEAILEPFGLHDDRIQRFLIEGDDVLLRPKQAVTFALVVQELATNAAKHGALTNRSSGRIHVSWQAVPGPRGELLRLRWKESGGPPVKPPERKGFGSHLIEVGLANELQGEVRLDYAPDGVVCEILMPFPRRDGDRP